MDTGGALQRGREKRAAFAEARGDESRHGKTQQYTLLVLDMSLPLWHAVPTTQVPTRFMLACMPLFVNSVW